MKALKRTYMLIIIGIVSIFIIGCLNSSVRAAEDNKKVVYLDKNNMTHEPISNNWENVIPGDKLTSEFYVANNNDFKCTIKNIIVDGELRNKEGQMLNKDNAEYQNYMNNLSMALFYEGRELFRQNLNDIENLDLTKINSPELNPNSEKKVSIEYLLNDSANNSTMNLTYKNNVHIIFSAVDGDTSIIDKGVGGGKLVQTGTFFDTKLLVILGILICTVGLIIFSSRYSKAKK